MANTFSQVQKAIQEFDESEKIEKSFDDFIKDFTEFFEEEVPEIILERVKEGEEEIFEKEIDSSGQQWERINTFSFLGRHSTKSVAGSPFRTLEAARKSALNAKPLVDTGSLRNAATGKNSRLQTDVEESGRDLDIEYGLDNFYGRDLETLQRGGPASGMKFGFRENMLLNVVQATTDGKPTKISKQVRSFIQNKEETGPGMVPAREFFWLNVNIKNLKDDLREGLEKIADEF